MTTPYAPDNSLFNPFTLMVSPELVIAAMERSERLNQLNRHLCRPLDRPAPAAAGSGGADGDQDGDDETASVDD